MQILCCPRVDTVLTQVRTMRTWCRPCEDPIQNLQSTIHTIHVCQDSHFIRTTITRNRTTMVFINCLLVVCTQYRNDASHPCFSASPLPLMWRFTSVTQQTMFYFTASYKLFEPTCSNDGLQCRSGEKCLLREYVCDSIKDCEDGSDEQHCPGWSNLDISLGCYLVWYILLCSKNLMPDVYFTSRFNAGKL